MTFSDKNTILNVIMMICIFNFVLLLSPLFFVERFTGDVVLSGTINSGEAFQGSPMFIKNKDVTFDFSTRVTEKEVRNELLNITLTTPDGVELSWLKRFECRIQTNEKIPIFGKDCSDFTMIFTPKSTGIYHIKISDAKFNTNMEIISGMVNPLKKNPLVLIGAIAFSFIGIMFIATVFNHNLNNSSKKQALIALLISVITVGLIYLYVI